MKNEKKDESVGFPFELKLSDGKTKKFRSGYEMYNWARINRPKWIFDEKEFWKNRETEQ